MKQIEEDQILVGSTLEAGIEDQLLDTYSIKYPDVTHSIYFKEGSWHLIAAGRADQEDDFSESQLEIIEWLDSQQSNK